MRTVGLITEYNPFHNGHLYHLEGSKKISGAEYSIAIMSGNFLQRGEPALVDKWTRAKMAIDNGVDLVIELPVVYACQSAEFFAFGSINILNSLGVVDSICFGSETGNVEILNEIAHILLDEPKLYTDYLKEFLCKGNSYPRSRQYALKKYLKSVNHKYSQEIGDVINHPNNILAIEYLKAIKKLDSKIIPYTIKRKNTGYHDKSLTDEISSATAIRESLLADLSLNKIKHTVPNATYIHLSNFLQYYENLNSIYNFSQIILYILRSCDHNKLKDIMDVSEGLDKRIINCAAANTTIDAILNCIITKRYTMTRLKRILMHLLIGLDKSLIQEIFSHGPQYIRVLGMNEKGIDLLKIIKKKGTLPIITKFADHKKFNNKTLNQMIGIDAKATDIYMTGLKKGKMNLDYLISPYIKKQN